MSDVGFGKKREKSFRPKKTKGQRGEKACFLLACLRFFVSFVCEKKEERFSREEDVIKNPDV